MPLSSFTNSFSAFSLIRVPRRPAGTSFTLSVASLLHWCFLPPVSSHFVPWPGTRRRGSGGPSVSHLYVHVSCRGRARLVTRWDSERIRCRAASYPPHDAVPARCPRCVVAWAISEARYVAREATTITSAGPVASRCLSRPQRRFAGSSRRVENDADTRDRVPIALHARASIRRRRGRAFRVWRGVSPGQLRAAVRVANV